jgi:hypothetical protein
VVAVVAVVALLEPQLSQVDQEVALVMADLAQDHQAD